MADIERTERAVVAFLVLTLLVGVGVSAYRNLRRPAAPKIETFSIGKTESAQRAGKVNINEAGIEELEGMDGLGKTLASRIVEYRSSNGAFILTEDIKKVRGIGPSVYEKIKDHISTE
jgi:comEA protein